MEKKYKQLSLEERTMIQTQLSMGFKPVRIAQGLGRSASTLSRELKHNGWVRPQALRNRGRLMAAGGYRAEVAHKRLVRSLTNRKEDVSFRLKGRRIPAASTKRAE